MFKKFMVIGSLVVGLIMLGGQEARARGFYNYGVNCCSALTITLDLRGVGGWVQNPTAVVGNIVLHTVEIYCLNPAGNAENQSTGEAYDQEVTDAEQIDGDNITGNGTATVQLMIPLESFEVAENCVSLEWNPVPGSAWPLSLFADVEWLDENFKVLDTLTLLCEVPPDAERDPFTHLAPHNVEYLCSATE